MHIYTQNGGREAREGRGGSERSRMRGRSEVVGRNENGEGMRMVEKGKMGEGREEELGKGGERLPPAPNQS
ncbi:hypothetical protein ACFXTN_032081 [Malus domestica]